MVMDFFYHLHWYDHRLTAPATEIVTLGSEWKDKLWIPDTYFRNSMSGGIPTVLHPSVYFTITNGTQVFMAARFQLKLSCNMEFTKFPFDNQICFVNITTCEYTVVI